MNKIFDVISKVNKIAIAGHVRPDGDCVGSCTAMCHYINEVYPEITVDVFLESVPEAYAFMTEGLVIHTTYEKNADYDVFISLDCGDVERLGQAVKYYKQAKTRINIDHHISNTNFGTMNIVRPEASSTCETLYSLLDESKLTKKIATSLYTGIIHDTGVFKHSNTSKDTMMIAGKLMALGVPYSKIIDESFYQKTYVQNQLLGRCLLESILILDGKCIVASISKEVLAFYGAVPKDIDGVIDQMRVTKGVEVAVLLYETDLLEYKVSMRSNEYVDVSKIAVYFGGGGHVRAAGCTMQGRSHDVINNLTKHIENQLQEQE